MTPAVQQQINANQAAIDSVLLKIQVTERKIDSVVEEINHVQNIKVDGETSENEMNRRWEVDTKLTKEKNQLTETVSQLREIEMLIRQENLVLLGKAERLSMIASRMAQVPHRNLTQSTVENLQRRSYPSEPANTKQVDFIGREAACAVIHSVAASNFQNRERFDHGGFTFMVASGHVRNGKTRTGIETPRLVDEMCSTLSHASSTEIHFAKTVYLKIDFLNGARFNPQVDVKGKDVSLALGSRLMNAFYKEKVWKEIRHDVALHHIITTVLADGGHDSSTIVPIVIHMDEHGKFIQAMDKDREKPVGKDYFEQLLCMIGSAATSEELPLSDLRTKGRYFIVAITTGTSFKNANFSDLNRYAVQKIPLPALDGPDTKRLAVQVLKLRRPKWSDEQLEKILSDSLFHIALADTAGLPGLIHFLCETSFDGSYVEYLKFRVMGYITAPNWSHHWSALTTIALARPRLEETSVIEGTYTLRDALDSGTVLYDEIEHEIRLVPVLLASYNAMQPTFNSLVVKNISREVVGCWTWQDFAKSHALYLSAIMMALQKEERRFNSHLTLRTLLRHVQPQDNVHLEQRLILSSDQKFNGIAFKMDANPCIFINPETSNGKCHGVRTECKDSVVFAAPGTPLIDAYLNLQLVRADSSGLEGEITTTLFIQYNHTTNVNTTTQPLQIKVSTMNEQARLLATILAKMGWDHSRLDWLILWVSNRPIQEDEAPHPKLLWVGKDNLVQHAPLIGPRGLVTQEL